MAERETQRHKLKNMLETPKFIYTSKKYTQLQVGQNQKLRAKADGKRV